MELLERFAKGEIDAFEALFREFQHEVYGWIVRIVRDPAAAEELTVDTFWRIYRSHARFDPRRSFGAWARRIASNVAIDHLKSSRPRPETSESPTVLDPDPIVRRERHDAIRKAFHALPARLRATATLALIEERPYEEIAQALGTSVAAVKSRIFRATRLLRRRLQRQGITP